MRFSRKSELLHEVIYNGLYAWALRTRMTSGFHLIKGRSPSLQKSRSNQVLFLDGLERVVEGSTTFGCQLQTRALQKVYVYVYETGIDFYVYP